MTRKLRDRIANDLEEFKLNIEQMKAQLVRVFT